MKEQVVAVLFVAGCFGALYIVCWDAYKKWIGIK